MGNRQEALLEHDTVPTFSVTRNQEDFVSRVGLDAAGVGEGAG